MALSMDEQRMLAEIERRLAAQDPGLASRLSSFKRPSPAAGLRTTQGKVISSICAIVLLAVIAATVCATIPFRAHAQKLTKQPTATSSTSAPVHAAKASIVKTGLPKNSLPKNSLAKNSLNPSGG